MKILILTFYYSPDLSAGSFRTQALVDALLAGSNDIELEVVTTLPNRYSGFAPEANEFEQHQRLSIHRVQLPAHKSGMMDQAKSFTHFYRKAKKLVKGKQYDLIYATSSRLFTAFLGSQIARKTNTPLYLDIRDIFRDTLQDVLSKKLMLFMNPIISRVENYAFNGASKINLVSRGFEGYFKSHYPQKSYSWFTNGIDDEFLQVSLPETPVINKKITILYAGNMGEGQGLHKIIPKLAKKLESAADFRIIGGGGRKAELEAAIEHEKVNNVTLLPSVKRDELLKAYQSADVLFLHLNDYPAFEKVLPSKIFEYAAVGKPILAGVSGYAAKFLKEEVENAAVFHPGNVDEALRAYSLLNLQTTPRPDFIEKFSRKKIMKEMAQDILCLWYRSEMRDSRY